MNRGVIDDAKEKMEGSLGTIREELKRLRTNRPDPSILDGVKVEVYGTQMAIRELASVGVDGRQLLITPFDPHTTSSIGKAIARSDLGLQPIAEENVVRVPFVEMDGEKRKEMVKRAKEIAERGKVAIRTHRRKAKETVKEEVAKSLISEDEKRRIEQEVQKMTDQSCLRVDRLYEEKERDILSL